MRLVEHFGSLFQSHFPVRSYSASSGFSSPAWRDHCSQCSQIIVSRALGFILCAACGSVVLLHAARVFDYSVVIEIAFMDNQALKQLVDWIQKRQVDNNLCIFGELERQVN